MSWEKLTNKVLLLYHIKNQKNNTMKKATMTVFGLTSDVIETADLKRLKEGAKKAGIKQRQAKEDLKNALLQVINNAKVESKKIAKDKKLSRSEKMRQIFDLGITSPKAISELLGSHYNFTYGVIRRYTGKEGAKVKSAE